MTVTILLVLSLQLSEIADDIDPTLLLELRAESRLRPAGFEDPDALAGGEVQITPSALAGLRFPFLGFGLRYMPSVVFASYEPLSEPLILHQGAARAFVELGTSFRLLAYHQRTQGEQNVSAAIIHDEFDGRRLRLEFLPEIERISVEGEQSTFGVNLDFGRWSSMRALGSIGSYGGATEEARRRLPKQSGPSGRLEIERGFGRRDAFLLELRGSRTEIEPGPTFIIGELESGWRHTRDRRTELQGLFGVFAGYNEEPVGDELRAVLLPTIRGGMLRNYSRGRHQAELELGFLARPWISLVHASLDPRVVLEGHLDWEWRRVMEGTIEVGHAWTLDERLSLSGRILAMNGSMAWPIRDYLNLEGGLRLFRQRARLGIGWWGSALWRWDLYIALSVSADMFNR